MAIGHLDRYRLEKATFMFAGCSISRYFCERSTGVDT